MKHLIMCGRPITNNLSNRVFSLIAECWISGVEIVTCKSLQPNDVPVIVVSCRAQEIHLYRKAKTGEIAAGTEDHIQLSTYAMVLTRIPEEFDNKVTDGWKIVEFARGGSRPFH